MSTHNAATHPNRRRRGRSLLLLALACTGLAVLLGACGGTSNVASDSGQGATSSQSGIASGGQPRSGGTFVVALGGDPPSFNLGPTVTFLTYQVSANVYSFLVRYDRDIRWQPDLATSWDISRDGRTWTFHLRKGVRWQDGSPFTSADVKFSFDRIHARYGGNTDTWSKVRVLTPDADTVVFKFPQYDALAYYEVGDFYSPIYPEHLWKDSVGSQEAMDHSRYARAPVGTGPFRFKSYQPSQQIVLERNDDYYEKGKPYLDQVVFRILPSADSRLSALQTGEINFMPRDINLNSVSQLKDSGNVAVEVSPRNATGHFYDLMVNVRRGPMANRTVRQAMSYAIDRDQIATTALFRQGSVDWDPLMNSNATNGQAILSPNLPRYPYDPDKAKQLLDQAGFPVGSDGTRFKVRLLVESSLPANVSMANLIQNDLKQVGIQVDLQTVDTPTAQALFYQQWDFDLYLVRLLTFNGAVIQLERRVTTNYIQRGTSLNANGYSNPTVDKLYDQATAEPDEAKRKQQLIEIQNQVATDLPMIPIANEPEVRAWTATFQGIPELTIGDETYDSVWQRGGS